MHDDAHIEQLPLGDLVSEQRGQSGFALQRRDEVGEGLRIDAERRPPLDCQLDELLEQVRAEIVRDAVATWSGTGAPR